LPTSKEVLVGGY